MQFYVFLNLCLVETLMLHIQVPSVSRITCMYRCLWLKVLAEYDYSLAPVVKETPVLLVFLYANCEGIHAQVTSQRGSGAPGIPGVLHSGEGDRSVSLVHFTLVERTGRTLTGARSKGYSHG